jgi:tRNA pseudouridine55 synthase
MMNGVLNINKPEGITSARAVQIIKTRLKLDKAGHTGTLDPFATGVLLICINKATKIAQYLSILDKEYIGTMILGIATDTQDLKGKIVQIKHIDQSMVNYERINDVFKSFIGEIWQKPPVFSAKKQNGVRLYNFARKGIKVNLSPNKIKIHDINIIKIMYDYFPSIIFRVRCSKGTYIRALSNDIGEKLGCGAYLSQLNRTEVGNYSIEHSINLDSFLKKQYQQQKKYIVTMDKSLSHYKKIILREDEKIKKRIKNENQFSDNEIDCIVNGKLNTTPMGIFRVSSSDGKLIALAKIIEGSGFPIKYKVEKVFE